MWDDVVIDNAGNALKKVGFTTSDGKKLEVIEEEKYEIISTNSVKKRRKQQLNTDWPLSPKN